MRSNYNFFIKLIEANSLIVKSIVRSLIMLNTMMGKENESFTYISISFEMMVYVIMISGKKSK